MKFELYTLTEKNTNTDYLVLFDTENNQVVQYLFLQNKYVETLIKENLKQKGKQKYYERKVKQEENETEKTLF